MSEKNLKKQKLSERILNEVNAYFRTRVSDTRLQFVSVTSVRLNRDNTLAKIYWDTFDNSKRGDAKKAIDSISGNVRTHLSKIIKMRQMPMIDFYYDSSFDSEQEITKILDDEKKSGKSF